MNTDQIILDQFVNNHPLKAVNVLKEFKHEEMVAFLEAEPLNTTVRIMSAMSSYKAAKCLKKMSRELALTILENMDLRMKITILRQCDERFRNQLLDAMAPLQSAILRQKLAFTTKTAGFLMNPFMLSLKNKLTVEESIIIAKNEKEHISSSILVVDSNGRPEGILKLHDLLFAESSTPIATLMKIEFPKFYADETIESIKNHPGWLDYQSIPVIDRSGILIGTLDFRSLSENKLNKREQNKNIVETSNALGELYRIGLTGFLHSVSK